MGCHQERGSGWGRGKGGCGEGEGRVSCLHPSAGVDLIKQVPLNKLQETWLEETDLDISVTHRHNIYEVVNTISN